MAQIDDYIIDVLMRDLVGHDRRPVSFMVYLWLATEEVRRGKAVQISYQELAECIGISKSSAQAAVGWLNRRKLLTADKETVTATPRYTVNYPRIGVVAVVIQIVHHALQVLANAALMSVDALPVLVDSRQVLATVLIAETLDACHHR